MIFSREIQPLTLPSSASNDAADAADVRFEISDLTEVNMEELTQAFETGMDMEWIHKDNDGNIDAKQLHHGSMYLLNCVINFARRNGYIIVARNGQGKYCGSLCLVPPYKRRWLQKLHFMASVVGFGMPVQKSMGKLISDKFDAYTSTMDHHHDQVMKNTPHWHVANLGVPRNAQGLGIGRKLLEVASSIAQKDGFPLYLECHNGNVAFYEKFGYEVKKKYQMTPKSDISDVLLFNAMVKTAYL